MNEEISVVIPTYKRPELLMKCLKALVNQSLEKNFFEIIVVSDGPDDLTEKAVKMWMHTSYPAVRYFPLAEKKGPAAARNMGWLQAKGQLIAFTDDDCIPEPDWLKSLWKSYNHENEIAYTGKIIVPLSQHPTDYELNTAGLETADFATANCACTKKALEKVGGFDERFKMAWREDSDLEFKLLKHQIAIHVVEEAVVVHPARKANWGVSIKEQKKGIYNALLYKKYPRLYRQKIKSQPKWNYYAILFLTFGMIIGLILKLSWLSLICFCAYLIILVLFIKKRLTGTSLSVKHISEMVVTSIIIPFISIFWQWYGAFKYRVLFI